MQENIVLIGTNSLELFAHYINAIETAFRKTVFDI